MEGSRYYRLSRKMKSFKRNYLSLNFQSHVSGKKSRCGEAVTSPYSGAAKSTLAAPLLDLASSAISGINMTSAICRSVI